MGVCATSWLNPLPPTHDEVYELMHQIIDPDDEWDPSTVRLRDHPLAEARAVEIAVLHTNAGMASIPTDLVMNELILLSPIH